MDGQWMSNGRTIVKERLTPLISDSKGSADADDKQLFWKGTFCFRAAQLIVKPFSRSENFLTFSLFTITSYLVKERLMPLISNGEGSADADDKQLFWKGTVCFQAAHIIVKPFSRRENLLITHRKAIVSPLYCRKVYIVHIF